jgi:hypothetical protein
MSFKIEVNAQTKKGRMVYNLIVSPPSNPYEGEGKEAVKRALTAQCGEEIETFWILRQL